MKRTCKNYDDSSLNFSYNYNKAGFIRLYIGPMFSGKTTSLLEDYIRYKIANKKCMLIKHNIDIRTKNISTHSKIENKATKTCKYLMEIDDEVKNYDVICIDEIQFFEDAPFYCDKWANEGLVIICAGLNGTFKREEFKVISQLIPLSEEIIKTNAVCRESGCAASFSYKISDTTDIIDIGGADKYTSVDRSTFNNFIIKKNYYEKQLELIKNIINLNNTYSKDKLKFNNDIANKIIKDKINITYKNIVNFFK